MTLSQTICKFHSLVPRPSHVFQRCKRKIGKAWSIMWCDDDVWKLFGTRFEISTYSPTHVLYSMNVVYVYTNDRTTATAHQKNISVTTTDATSSAVIVTLWTACSLCHGQLSSRPNPLSSMTKRAGGSHSVIMTAELVKPVVRQGYRAILLTCTVCCCRCLIVGTYTIVKYVHGRVGGDFKPHPK